MAEAAQQEGHGAETDLDLEVDEQKEAESRSSLRAHVVYVAVKKEGEDELARPLSSLFWSALAAGLSMGFSMLTEGLLRSHLPPSPWRDLISKLGYSVGFLVVVLGRQQLFTENTLTVVLPLLSARSGNRTAILSKVALLWAVVLAGNILGAIAFSGVATRAPIFEPAAHDAFLALGAQALRYGFWTTVVKGIFAGWLIALMVWLLPAAEGTKLHVILITTYVVALGEFAHVVAGSVDVLSLVWAGRLAAWSYVARFLAPALLGNMIGGVSLVAALNHAQVSEEHGEKPDREKKPRPAKPWRYVEAEG